MFKLIKKDLIVGLKVRSLKTAIITFIIGLFLLTAFSFIFPTILPIMITFIVVMNSFYYDTINKSESFMLSLPNKREDVVYSKYILILIVLFVSLASMYILFGINILKSPRVMVLQDVFVSSVTILFSFGIIIPIIFKYGYKIGRIIAPIITIFIGYLSYKSSRAYEFLNTGDETLLIGFSRKIGVLIYKIFNFKNYDYKIMSMNVYFILLIAITLILFITSLYISLRIYKNKDLA